MESAALVIELSRFEPMPPIERWHPACCREGTVALCELRSDYLALDRRLNSTGERGGVVRGRYGSYSTGDERASTTNLYASTATVSTATALIVRDIVRATNTSYIVVLASASSSLVIAEHILKWEL